MSDLTVVPINCQRASKLALGMTLGRLQRAMGSLDLVDHLSQQPRLRVSRCDSRRKNRLFAEARILGLEC